MRLLFRISLISLLSLTLALLIKLSLSSGNVDFFDKAYAAGTVHYRYKVVEIDDEARRLSSALISTSADREKVLNNYGLKGWEYAGSLPGRFSVDIILKRTE